MSLVLDNPDIKKLVAEGYSLIVSDNFLIVDDVFHLSSDGALVQGQIGFGLGPSNTPFIASDHQVYFTNTCAYLSDSKPIPGVNFMRQKYMPPGSTLKIEFLSRPSSKLKNEHGQFRAFEGIYEKVDHYVGLFTAPAIDKYQCIFRSRKPIRLITGESPFEWEDTHSSRYDLNTYNNKINEENVLIIGLGGTGSYILDLLAKTPVNSISLFDDDLFENHTAFRSPGEQSLKEINSSKVHVYLKRYQSFHKNIVAYKKRVELDSDIPSGKYHFAFLAVDNASSRMNIANILRKRNIPFIDVGIGLQKQSIKEENFLNGMIRTTPVLNFSNQTEDFDNLPSVDANDEYNKQVQIAELNALNASLAVILYKRYKRVFSTDINISNMVLSISDMDLTIT